MHGSVMFRPQGPNDEEAYMLTALNYNPCDHFTGA